MNYKSLAFEFVQASALAAILGLEKGEHVIEASFIALLLGGIPMMLAKRFVISFIKEIKQL
ncbi:MAG: hypothetical protein ACRC1W_00840 [Shewanella sp.]